MRKTRHTLARFEEHSLALFTALVLGSAGVAAQTRPPGPPTEDAVVNAQVFGPATAKTAAPTAATAATAAIGRSADQAFGRADANGDGRLSREEAQRLPAVAERFGDIDTNSDRFLSRDEFLRGVSN